MQMVSRTKGRLSKEGRAEEEHIRMWVETGMMAIGRTTYLTDKVSLRTSQEIRSRAHGLMVNPMESLKFNWNPERAIEVATLRVSAKARESSDSPTEHNLMVHGTTMFRLVLPRFNTPVAVDMRALSRIIVNMAMESWHLQKGLTRATGSEIRKMGQAQWIFQMVTSIKDNGVTAWKMAQEPINITTATSTLADGVRIKSRAKELYKCPLEMCIVEDGCTARRKAEAPISLPTKTCTKVTTPIKPGHFK